MKAASAALFRSTVLCTCRVAFGSRRLLSSKSSLLSPGEQVIATKLSTQPSLQPVTFLRVSDISGGCGSMYSVHIETPAFRGLSLLKQHTLVKDAIKSDIVQMHGIQLKTAAPPESTNSSSGDK